MRVQLESWLGLVLLLSLQAVAFADQTSPASESRTAYTNAPVTDAMDSLAQFNLYFNKEYDAIAQKLGNSVFPVLTANGEVLTLYTQDGKVRRFASAIIPPVNELKDISHVGPGLFAIGYPSWENNNDESWKAKMQAYQKLVKDGLAKIDKVDWSNPAWDRAYTKKLKTFMRESLTFVDDSLSGILKKGTYTREDYSKFCEKYMHTMGLTMYLADLSNAKQKIDVLKQWKKEIGDEQWGKMYALLFGDLGRPGSGLSIDTNPMAYQISSMMKPENRSKIMLLPQLDSDEDAKALLGSKLLARALGEASFTKERMKQFPIGKGMHDGLMDSTTNVSMRNDKDIAIEYLEKGKVKLPVPDWVNKETIKFH